MKILVFALFVGIAGFVNGQDLIFNINQFGTSYKNPETKQFDEAEIKASQLMITLQDKTVKVLDEFVHTFSLEKRNSQSNNIKHVHSQTWKAIDANKRSYEFKFTVNIETKEAMVEVGNNEFKNYYFGKFSYGNLKNNNTEVANSIE